MGMGQYNAALCDVPGDDASWLEALSTVDDARLPLMGEQQPVEVAVNVGQVERGGIAEADAGASKGTKPD
jgi:hypothetical protein